MDHRLMQDLHSGFCEMLHEIAGDKMGSREVEVAKNAISGILKLKCIEEMENFSGSSYRGGRSYDGDMRGASYRRSRDEGGGSYRGGYSRDGGSMRQKLQRLMDEAGNERERNMLHEMMDKLEN